VTLLGRVAIVTGAASGIGRAVAQRLAADGARVVLADLDAAGADVAERLGGVFVRADLADPADCHAIVEAAVAHYGTVQILVNNAGLQHVAPLDEFPDERWEHLLAVMLTAPFRLTRAAWPHMRAQGWGRIINISSLNAFRAEPHKCAYNAAKSGLLGLTQTAAVEGGPLGITAHAICPGLVRTGLVERQIPAVAQAHSVQPDEVVAKVFLRNAPIKRFIEPAEIAALVAFLCSDETGAMSGSPILFDQGISAGV
jgi:3-hydroxybutyrate dehydrogenase